MAKFDVVKKTLISIPFIHFGCILFGAPFLYDFVVTLIFSIWLSIIGILPLMLATNAQSNVFMSVIFERKTVTVAQKYALWAFIGSVGGAWFGSIVVPLDWDRWWQRWPIPCAIGSAIGVVLTLTLCTLLKRVSSITYRKYV
ncbi:Nitrogen permease regulator 2 [Aphelenchoides besseyi]|nr:Nitrogen permease regulator 2 [Aphelenchoides besseyi]KAI6194915.1 Nitrogen permease regulator 2 [Aphelenchoides besseyi]